MIIEKLKIKKEEHFGRKRMDHHQLLRLIISYNSKKQTRSKLKKLYIIDKILDVNTKNYRYVGGERETLKVEREKEFKNI
jgi:hypothetical protein